MITPGKYQGFEVEIHDPGIVLVRFNMPDRLNGMTMEMKRDLLEIVMQVQQDESARVLVYTGSGRAFSAGDDITGREVDYGGGKALVPPIDVGFSRAKNHQLGTYDSLRALSQPINIWTRNLSKMTIAAINGVAVQTGFSLALCCDFRIASSDAKMGSATLRFGLMPDEGGQYLLLKILGLPKTLDFLMRSKIVPAAEALELGLVHEVVEPDKLLERTLELARELANGPQVAMRMLKKSIYNAMDLTFEQSLEEIAAKTALSDPQPDAREGVAAFREKRKPNFNQWMK